VEAFKIEEFLKDNPGENFPQFKKLRPDESDNIRSVLAARLGMDTNTNPLQLFLSLLEVSRTLVDVDIDASDFSLASVVASFGVKPTQHAYIDWRRFEDIDCFKFSDLDNYFKPICTDYLGDDVCVFDDTLEWLIFVMHYERVQVVRFNLDSAKTQVLR